MKPIKLKINTKTQQYSIIIGSNLVSNISKILKENSINLMKKNNPVVIPRNNLVDNAIKKAVNGNIVPFNRLLKIFSNPYQYQEGLDEFMKPPEKKFEECFQTYCGT